MDIWQGGHVSHHPILQRALRTSRNSEPCILNKCNAAYTLAEFSATSHYSDDKMRIILQHNMAAINMQLKCQNKMIHREEVKCI